MIRAFDTKEARQAFVDRLSFAQGFPHPPDGFAGDVAKARAQWWTLSADERETIILGAIPPEWVGWSLVQDPIENEAEAIAQAYNSAAEILDTYAKADAAAQAEIEAELAKDSKTIAVLATDKAAADAVLKGKPIEQHAAEIGRYSAHFAEDAEIWFEDPAATEAKFGRKITVQDLDDHRIAADLADDSRPADWGRVVGVLDAAAATK